MNRSSLDPSAIRGLDEAVERKALENYRIENRRAFALQWLASMFYDLPLNLITDKDDSNVYSAKMAQNERLVEDFLRSWPRIKQTTVFTEMIRHMNAGEKWEPIKSKLGN